MDTGSQANSALGDPSEDDFEDEGDATQQDESFIDVVDSGIGGSESQGAGTSGPPSVISSAGGAWCKLFMKEVVDNQVLYFQCNFCR